MFVGRAFQMGTSIKGFFTAVGNGKVAWVSRGVS
jgi:hypothetical protein